MIEVSTTMLVLLLSSSVILYLYFERLIALVVGG